MLKALSKKPLVILVFIVALFIAIIAYLRDVDLNLAVEKKGLKGNMHFETEEKNKTGIVINQNAKRVKGNITAIKASDSKLNTSTNINVSQKVDVIEGSVVGIDLSNRPIEMP